MTHHALLIYNETPLTYSVTAELQKKPDRLYQLEKCTIADVREIIQAAWLRPAGEGTDQLIVVATEFIVEEAQQALLKIVEEPPAGTTFVFVLPPGYSVLPTLQSRFQVIKTAAEPAVAFTFEELLNSTISERMQQIELALKQKDTAWQKAIKVGLGEYLKQSKSLSPQVTKELTYVLMTLMTRGASNKFLLEQLALVLPPGSKSAV